MVFKIFSNSAIFFKFSGLSFIFLRVPRVPFGF